jgi:hypothetical protein
VVFFGIMDGTSQENLATFFFARSYLLSFAPS